MSVFLVFALVLVLAIATKKRWLPMPAWLLKLLARNHGHIVDGAKLEIVVERDSSSSQTPSRTGGDKAPVARKSLYTKPPRYEGPVHASAGSMETSIRSALNELRSRQVVKNLCSKFEARVARHSTTSSVADDEESCIRAANDGDDEYVLPEQSQLLRREEPRAVPAPFAHRRSSNAANAANAAKPNNLNAFLRRYSSNLDRANAAAAAATAVGGPASSTSEPATTTLETVAITPATLVPSTPAPAPAQAFVPQPVVAEIETLDLQLQLVGDSDEVSNQCDSPVRDEPPSVAFVDRSTFEPASDDEGECSLSSGNHISDWDVTRASKCPQSPEQGLQEDKPVRNSVARFRQFQLQIPPNHARSVAGSAQ